MLPHARVSVLLMFILPTLSVDRVIADDYSQPGPLAVAQQTVQIRRANGLQCETWVYFPSENNKPRQRLDSRQAPYPVVVFTSPVMSMSVYAQTLSHLASWGFVVMAPTDGMELLPDQAAVADDMRLCLDYMSAENTRPQSTFYGAINPKRASFLGHSWGGACSVIAGAKEDERLKLVMNLACWGKSNPSPKSCVGNLRCPLIMLTGDDDVVTPLPSVQAIYDAAVPAKSLIVLSGGTHFGFIDNWLSVPSLTLTPHDQQLAVARHYLTVALLLHLRDQRELQPLLWEAGTPSFGNVKRMIYPASPAPGEQNP